MPSAYVLTPIAKADIFGIWSYIADDNEAAADRVELRIPFLFSWNIHCYNSDVVELDVCSDLNVEYATFECSAQ